MTLPSSGGISISQINTEVGAPTTAARDLNWVRSITKGAGNPFALNFLYGKACFKSNKDGNCNNGNCAQTVGTANCGDGYGGSGNCVNSATNCANCDGQALIQANCNCACTYNCNAAPVYLNCNCNCSGRC